MTTPNNAAAAVERLEQKWRAEAVRRSFMSGSQIFEACADELATLRATLAQPDTLTSQPSGEAVAIIDINEVNHGEGWIDSVPLTSAGRNLPIGRHLLYTHPSADAPGVAVDDEMVNRALKVWYGDDLEAHDMRAALTAALAPKPEGGHG